jgi:hypothetical protein
MMKPAEMIKNKKTGMEIKTNKNLKEKWKKKFPQIIAKPEEIIKNRSWIWDKQQTKKHLLQANHWNPDGKSGDLQN